MGRLHGEFGSLTLTQVLEPAIELAERHRHSGDGGAYEAGKASYAGMRSRGA